MEEDIKLIIDAPLSGANYAAIVVDDKTRLFVGGSCPAYVVGNVIHCGASDSYKTSGTREQLLTLGEINVMRDEYGEITAIRFPVIKDEK